MSVDPFAFGSFVPLFEHVRRVPNTTYAHQRVYGALASFRGKGADRDCCPRVSQLCARLGMSDQRTVRKLLADLERLGLITVDRSGNPSGRPSRYTFEIHQWMSDEPHGGDSPRGEDAPLGNGPPGGNSPGGEDAPRGPGLDAPEPPGLVPPDPPGQITAHSKNKNKTVGENKEQNSTPRSRSVDAVFAYWLLIMGKASTTLLTKDRQTKLKARRRDGYTDAQLCQAIDGCKLSGWHMGENDRGETYNDLATILRDGKTVDAHIQRLTQGGPKPSRNGRLPPAYGTTSKDFEDTPALDEQLAQLGLVGNP